MTDSGSGPPNLGVGDALHDEDMISDIDPYADFDEIVDPAAVHEDQDMGEDISSYQMFDASNNLSFEDAQMNVDASTSLASIHEVTNVSANASNHLTVGNSYDNQSDLLEWDEDADEIDYPPFEEVSPQNAAPANASATANLPSINNQPPNSDLAEDSHYTDRSQSTEIQEGEGANASADEIPAPAERHSVLSSAANQLEHGDDVESDDGGVRLAAGNLDHNGQLYDEDEQLHSAVVAASVSAPVQTTNSAHVSNEVKARNEGNGAVEDILSKDVAQIVQVQSASNLENNVADHFRDMFGDDGANYDGQEPVILDYAGCAEQVSADFSQSRLEWNVVPTIICEYRGNEFALFPPVRGIPELAEFESWNCLLSDTQIAFQKMSVFFMHVRSALLDIPPSHELVLTIPVLKIEIAEVSSLSEPQLWDQPFMGGQFESRKEANLWYSMRLILHIFHQLQQNDDSNQLSPLHVALSTRPGKPLGMQAIDALYRMASAGHGLSVVYPSSVEENPSSLSRHDNSDVNYRGNSGHDVALAVGEGGEPLEDSRAGNDGTDHEAASSLEIQHPTAAVQPTHEPGTVTYDAEDEVEAHHEEDSEAHQEEEGFDEVQEEEEDFEDEEEQAVELQEEDGQVAGTGKEEAGATQETEEEVGETREEEAVPEAHDEQEADEVHESPELAETAAQAAHSAQSAKDTFPGGPNYFEDEITDDFYDEPHVTAANAGEQYNGGNDGFDADETASSTINQDSGFSQSECSLGGYSPRPLIFWIDFGLHYNELAVESAFDGIDEINNVDTYEGFGEDRTLGAGEEIVESAGPVVTTQEDDQEAQVGIVPENDQEPHAEPTNLSSVQNPNGEYAAALTEENIRQLDQAQPLSHTRVDDDDRLSFHTSLDGPWEDFCKKYSGPSGEIDWSDEGDNERADPANADGKVATSLKDTQENVVTDLSALPLDNGTIPELTSSELTRKRPHTDLDDADHVGEEQAEPKRLRLSPEADEDEIV